MKTISAPALSLDANRLGAWLSGLGFVATLIALVLSDDASRLVRLALVCGLVGVPTVLYLGQYLVRWAIAMWGRARHYQDLVTEAQSQQQKNATLLADVARALRIAPIPVPRILVSGADVRIVFKPRDEDDPQPSDRLILVDTVVGSRVVAGAFVDMSHADRTEAVVDWYTDPVAHGWFKDNISPLGAGLPEGIVVLSEKAVENKIRQILESPEPEVNDE